MINNKRTEEIFGYHPDILRSDSKQKVVVNCRECCREKIVSYTNAKYRPTSCKNCANLKRPRSLAPQELPKFILIEETIKRCGYDPREYVFTKYSRKKIVMKCAGCKKLRVIEFCENEKMCYPCGIKKRNEGRHIIQTSLKVRKLPKWIDVKETVKQFGYNPAKISLLSHKPVITACIACGEKRVQQNSTVMKSQGFCRVCALQDAGIRKKISDTVTKNPSGYGRVNDVFTAYGGYYFCKQYNKNVWLRSSWEIAYAKYLDENKIDWTYEPRFFRVQYEIDGEIKNGTYTPDFYLTESNTYIEVKGWWRTEAKLKFAAIRDQYRFAVGSRGQSEIQRT